MCLYLAEHNSEQHSYMLMIDFSTSWKTKESMKINLLCFCKRNHLSLSGPAKVLAALSMLLSINSFIREMLDLEQKVSSTSFNIEDKSWGDPFVNLHVMSRGRWTSFVAQQGSNRHTFTTGCCSQLIFRIVFLHLFLDIRKETARWLGNSTYIIKGQR